MTGERDFERRLEVIERGIREIEASADAGLRATAQQLVQAILDLHGAGLERLLEIVHAAGAGGQDLIDQLGSDRRVAQLLLLHSLHPLTLDERVRRALEGLEGTARAQHAEIELGGIEEGVVRVRVHGSASLGPMVEAAILEAAPDAAGIEVENTADPTVVGFVPLVTLRASDLAGPSPARAVMQVNGT